MPTITLPQRKRNRKLGYDYAMQGAYFITICVKDRLGLLSTIGDDAHIVPNKNNITPNNHEIISNEGEHPDSGRCGHPPVQHLPVRLSQYGMVVEKYIKNMVGIDKYVIMPDHIHLIILITDNDEESIPQKIKSLKILVTKEIGFSLWQRSYHDRIIRNENEYQRIWEYIDHNPDQWAYKQIKP